MPFPRVTSGRCYPSWSYDVVWSSPLLLPSNWDRLPTVPHPRADQQCNSKCEFDLLPCSPGSKVGQGLLDRLCCVFKTNMMFLLAKWGQVKCSFETAFLALTVARRTCAFSSSKVSPARKTCACTAMQQCLQHGTTCAFRGIQKN